MKELSFESKRVPLCLALGFFDGVHIGHREIFRQVVSAASRYGAYSAATTFLGSPSFAAKTSGLIYPYAVRKQIFGECGLDYVLALRLDNELKTMAYDEFLRRLFCAFDIKFICCGHDYKFGYKALGTAEILGEITKQKNIEFFVQPPIEIHSKRVSSTAIKGHILSGDIIAVNTALGANYRLCGRVERGLGIGAGLNAPTANIKIPKNQVLLHSGVYKTSALINGVEYASVTSVGGSPTLGKSEAMAETHIIDFCGDLYKKNITVFFHSRMRDLIEFDKKSELKNQIALDIKERL